MFHLGEAENMSGNTNVEMMSDDSKKINVAAVQPDNNVLKTTMDTKSLGVLELSSVIINTVLFVVCLALIFIQNFTSTISTSRMSTAVTQDVSLWINSDVAKRHVFDDLVFPSGMNLSSSCMIFTGGHSAYSNMHGRPVTLSISSIDTRYLMAAFYGITAFFQSLSMSSFSDSLSKGSSHIAGYIERCFTDPLLMIIMCAQVGITDVNIIVSTSCGMLFCLVLGMLTEVLFDDDSNKNYFLFWDVAQFHYYAISHFVSWIALVVAFSPILLTLSTVRTCFMNPDTFGDLIITVVLMETFAFGIMQFIQFFSLKYKPRHLKEQNNQAIHDKRVSIALTVEYAVVIIRIISGFFFFVLIYVANNV
jgi:hypothetical protein